MFCLRYSANDLLTRQRRKARDALSALMHEHSERRLGALIVSDYERDFLVIELLYIKRDLTPFKVL